MDTENMVISYRFTLFSIIICRILDVFTTQIALNGGAYEVNPFARFIFNVIGSNNIIYTLPFHIIVTIIGVSVIYYIINHVKFSNNNNFYIGLWNIIIISLILFNILCPINNILVIGGII